MKKKFSLLVFGLLIYSISWSQNVDKELDKFASDCFQAISKNHFEALKVYLASQTEYAEIAKNEKFSSEEARKNALSKADSKVEKSHEAIKTGFSNIIKNAKNSGIKWENCSYVGYRIINTQKLNQITKADIAIIFKNKDIAEYEIHLGNCYKLKRGWVIWKSMGGPW